MGIITISRGSYSQGKYVAERLSKELGYACISREFLLQASKDFNIPELQLLGAIQDAPTILERFKYGKKKYVAYIREAFLEHIKQDNIVYHGFAGHFFTRGIPNILKLRIIADLDFRIDRVMKNENVSYGKARKMLTRIDEERRKWSTHLYGIDCKSSELYDLSLRIDCLGVDEIVEAILKLTKCSCFQTTPDTIKKINDHLVSARAYSVLVDSFPDTIVKSNNGTVYVTLEASSAVEDEVTRKVEKMLKGTKGVTDIKTYVIPFDS